MSDLAEEGKLSKELMEEISNDMKIERYSSTNELKQMCRDSATLTQKYTEMYYSYKRNMNKLQVKLKNIEGDLFRKIKNDGYDGLSISSSSDIFTLIKREKSYVVLKGYVNEFEMAVEFLEQTIKNFNTRSWKLRDLVEIEKIDNMGV